MRRRATSLVVLAGFFAVAAGGIIARAYPALAQQAPRKAVAVQPSISDPVYPAGFDAAMLARLVDGHLADARAARERLIGAKGKRTAANTLRPFDDAINATQLADGLTTIAAQLHRTA